MPGGESRLGVMPHKLRDFKKPGHIWTLAELADPGRCVFYDRGRCTIYAQRPYECARMQHAHTDAQTCQLRYFIVEQWGPRQLAPYLNWAGKHRTPRTKRRRT